MTQFVIVEHDFADDCDSVWLLGRIADNPEGFLGAYVTQDGNVLFSDKSVWGIELDLERIGIDPWSDEGLDLIANWETFARKAGLELLKPFIHQRTGVMTQNDDTTKGGGQTTILPHHKRSHEPLFANQPRRAPSRLRTSAQAGTRSRCTNKTQ